jgi:AraC-like DNA-binding protein
LQENGMTDSAPASTPFPTYKRPGRKPYTPTDEQRRTVRAMAGYGVPQEAIAKVVRCSEPTLRRNFRHELDTAVTEANARVAQCLYQQATTPGNVAASIFWLKARAGWREKHAVEISGPDGKAPEPMVVRVQLRDETSLWTAEGGSTPPQPRPSHLIEGERE